MDLKTSPGQPAGQIGLGHTLPFNLRTSESGRMALARLEGPLDTATSASYCRRVKRVLAAVASLALLVWAVSSAVSAGDPPPGSLVFHGASSPAKSA